MNITRKDLEISKNFFNTELENVLANTARKMNIKHPSIPETFRALENSGVNGFLIDDLMLSILIIWYSVEILNKIEISRITEKDIQKNFEKFMSCVKFFAEEDLNNYSIEDIDFIKNKIISDYALDRLKEFYNQHKPFPKEACYVFMALVKCFEGKMDE